MSLFPIYTFRKSIAKHLSGLKFCNTFSKSISIEKFPHHCAYKAFEDDGMIWDSHLCQSCEIYWYRLRQLMDNPILLILFNQQQEEINQLKQKIEQIQVCLKLNE